MIALLLTGWLIHENAKVPTETSKKPIVIGGMFALTGKWEVGGRTEANFAQLAVSEINARGGVLGRPIKLLLEDEKCSGKESVSAMRKLINQHDVRIILGPSCTPASGPVAPIAQENQVFMLALTTTANNIFDDYSYAFRMSPPGSEAAQLIAARAYDIGARRVALITEQTDFAKSWSDAFAGEFTSLGGEIVNTENYTTGTTDFRTIVQKIINSEPDTVFLGVQTPQDGGLIVKQMHEMGVLNSVQIIGNPTAIDVQSYTASNALLPKSAFTIVPQALNTELLEKYRSSYGSEPGFTFFYTAAAYDAIYLIKDALEYCESDDATCVRDYFTDKLKNRNGAVTSWSFKNNGDPVIPKNLYKELRIIDGEKRFFAI